MPSPASNVAIFGGKVVGSIIPRLVYALIGEVVYLFWVVVLLGPAWLNQLPLWLGMSLIALVPAAAATWRREEVLSLT